MKRFLNNVLLPCELTLVTVTNIGPAVVPAGRMQVIFLSEFTKQLAVVEPKLTIPFVRFRPYKMISGPPPANGPAGGTILLMEGDTWFVKLLPSLTTEPPGVEMVTDT